MQTNLCKSCRKRPSMVAQDFCFICLSEIKNKYPQADINQIIQPKNPISEYKKIQIKFYLIYGSIAAFFICMLLAAFGIINNNKLNESEIIEAAHARLKIQSVDMNINFDNTEYPRIYKQGKSWTIKENYTSTNSLGIVQRHFYVAYSNIKNPANITELYIDGE